MSSGLRTFTYQEGRGETRCRVEREEKNIIRVERESESKREREREREIDTLIHLQSTVTFFLSLASYSFFMFAMCCSMTLMTLRRSTVGFWSAAVDRGLVR